MLARALPAVITSSGWTGGIVRLGRRGRRARSWRMSFRRPRACASHTRCAARSGGGHRLEAAALGVERCEYLRAGVALEKLDLYATAGGRDREAAGLGHVIEGVVELMLGECEALGGQLLLGGDRYLVGVERQPAHRR